jgi:sialic acid synthase
MKKTNKIVALIPLRGGSKSIPLKNIKLIAGEPLCYWSIEAAKKSGCFDEIWVSTDHPEIKAVALSLGAKVLDRPAKFASDTASTESVMLHFMSKVNFDILVTLQATSPLTSASDIKSAFSKFNKGKFDSLLTVVESKRFFWNKKGESLNYDYMKRPRRQDFKGSLMENGAFYITKRDVLKKYKNRLGGKIGIYKMSEKTAYEIDEELDWIIVEQLLENKYEKNSKKVCVIAEIGCNHTGSIKIAKKMIRVAKTYVKADVVKFQKRHIKTLLTEKQYLAAHPNPHNSYGKTYGAHREFLELNLKQHRLLKKYCEKLGIIYSCSVWDIVSAKEIVSLKPKFIKVPSATNLNFEVVGYLCEKFQGEIHISLGMTTKEEIEKIFQFVKKKNRLKDVVFYSCTSGYPVDFDDVCLLEINRLKEKYQRYIKGIGFSGHHAGIAIDMAAVTLGAEYIERHFTLDRSWKGTDHAASLEPDGFRKLVRDIRATEKTLKFKKSDILPVEEVQRKKLKRV